MEELLPIKCQELKSLEEGLAQVILLDQIEVKMEQLIRQILEELQLNKDLFKNKKLPTTIGTIVSIIFKEYIKEHFGTDRARLESLNKKWQSKNVAGKRINSILSGGNIESIVKSYPHTSGILNSITQGGRTNNERWQEFHLKNILDLDFSSCYLNTLKTLDYPIGLPTIVHYDNQQKKLTLKEFLIKYQNELVPHMFTITISGKLKHSQNLLYSKIITVNQLEKFKDENKGHLIILENELINTILTTDLIEALKKICTNTEWNDITNSTVITAMLYKKSDQCTKEEFLNKLEEINSNEKRYVSKKGEGDLIDNRPKCWYPIPLNPLFENLHLMRQKTKIEKNKGLELIIKTITNTIYGVISSPIFGISNTVVSNVTTARARLAIWLTSRALNGIQCITDGHAYNPLTTFKIKRKKEKLPSLSRLSNLYKLKQHRNIEQIKLGNKDWEELYSTKNIKKITENIDSIATKHIEDFWKNYNIDIQ
jgi:hypothetical protein